MKFIYPIPREDSAGIKNGPCGNTDFSDGIRTILEPNAEVTLVIQEVIHHVGAPYRIALSHVNEDSYEDCILLVSSIMFYSNMWINMNVFMC